MLAPLARRFADLLLALYETGTGFVVLLVVLACSMRYADRLFRGIKRALWRVSRRPAVATVGVGMFAALLACLLSQARWPEPRIHDEFTHLLVADTISRGRVANPPHPMWRHFESPHTIYEPTYAAKYPPGPGIMMAAGKVVGGYPVVGLWVTQGLLAMAVCWMLMAWLRPPWALLGGLLVALHTQALYWSQNYIGGGLSMLAGTLVIGGVLHLLQRVRLGPSVLLGIGLAILMNTRPAEGLILCAVLGIALLARRISHGAPDLSLIVRKVVVPVTLILLPTIAGMLYYNWRITGNAFKLPYMLHAQMYSVAPNFVWQPLGAEPQYRHKELRDLHVGYEVGQYQKHVGAQNYAIENLYKLDFLLRETFSPAVLAIPLVALPFAWRRNRRVLFAALALVAFVLIVTLSEVFTNTHYLAPAGGLLVALIVYGIRYLRTWQFHGRQIGRIVVRGVLVMVGIAAINWVVYTSRNTGWQHERAAIVREVSGSPDKHLILVRYAPGHDVHAEWVFNEADIDGAKIVWARDMGPASNAELIEYFKDRQPWLLEADVAPRQLTAYPTPTTTAASAATTAPSAAPQTPAPGRNSD